MGNIKNDPKMMFLMTLKVYKSTYDENILYIQKNSNNMKEEQTSKLG